MKFRKKHGFTLIELLIVIAIIAILATIIIVSTSNARLKSQTSVAKNTLQTFKKAIMLYQNETGGTPFPTGDAAAGGNVWCKPGWPTNGGGTGTCFGELSAYISDYKKEGPYGKCTQTSRLYTDCYNYSNVYGNNVMLLIRLNPVDTSGPLNGPNLPTTPNSDYCNQTTRTNYCDGYKFR